MKSLLSTLNPCVSAGEKKILKHEFFFSFGIGSQPGTNVTAPEDYTVLKPIESKQSIPSIRFLIHCIQYAHCTTTSLNRISSGFLPCFAPVVSLCSSLGDQWGFLIFPLWCFSCVLLGVSSYSFSSLMFPLWCFLMFLSCCSLIFPGRKFLMFLPIVT
jgi:hypothetical protein